MLSQAVQGSMFVAFIRIWRNTTVLVSILTIDENTNNKHCTEASIVRAMNLTGIHLARMCDDVVDTRLIIIPILDSSGRGLGVAT